MDIVMQGPIWPNTLADAETYTQHPLVDKVVISTWKGEPIIEPREGIVVIHSDVLENPGMGNRNRQIYSSLTGIRSCTADIVVKTRTDQRIDDIEKMYAYFMRHNQIDIPGAKGAIFVLGLFTRFPFHPQDHLFFGWREDMINLFDIPLDTEVPNVNQITDNSGAYTDYAHSITRPNTYIGMHYYARFDDYVQYMIDHYKDYIVDAAPNIEQALKVDKYYRDTIFKAFPRVKLWWYKHSRSYPYEWGAAYSEYCASG